MPAPILGLGTWLGWSAPESSWDTLTARAKYARLVSSNITVKPDIQQIPHLYGDGDGFEDQGQAVEVRRAVEVEFELVMRYANLGYPLKAWLGGVATTGAGPTYTHTFSPPSVGTDYPSLTLEHSIGNSGNSEVIRGFMAQEGSLMIETGQPGARFKLKGIAGTAAAPASAGTPTFGTGPIVLAHHLPAAGLTFNGSTYPVQSVEFSVNSQHGPLYECGALGTSQPVRSNLGQARLKVKLAPRDEALFTALLAGTTGSLSLVATQPSSGETLTIASSNARVMPFGRGISGQGPLSRDAEFALMGSGSTNAYSLAIVNTEANYYD